MVVWCVYASCAYIYSARWFTWGTAEGEQSSGVYCGCLVCICIMCSEILGSITGIMIVVYFNKLFQYIRMDGIIHRLLGLQLKQFMACLLLCPFNLCIKQNMRWLSLFVKD